MKKICKKLTGKFLQNWFFLLATYFLTSDLNSLSQMNEFPLWIAQNGQWNVSFMKNLSFSSIFHAFSRPNLPPVYPFPIPGPYQPFRLVIPLYRLSILPTSSSHLSPPKFPSNFFRVYPFSIQNTYPGILALILSYRNLSQPTCRPSRQPDKFSPQATKPWFYMRFAYIL